MKFYSFLRRWLRPSDAMMGTALWYAILMVMIFVALSQNGIDLRYANM